MGESNAEKERGTFWKALGVVGTLIVFASILCGITACALIWETTMPSLGWQFASSEAKSTFGVWLVAIILGVLVNIGFGMFLLAVGEILAEIKTISIGLQPTREQEDQAGDGSGSS